MFEIKELKDWFPGIACKHPLVVLHFPQKVPSAFASLLVVVIEDVCFRTCLPAATRLDPNCQAQVGSRFAEYRRWGLINCGRILKHFLGCPIVQIMKQ